MPVLVIAGQDDEIAPAPGQHTLVEALPDAELVMLDDVGHLIHYEQPVRAAGCHPPVPEIPRVKILVDCRYTRLGHHDGISRYAARIVEALARRVSADGRHTVRC